MIKEMSPEEFYLELPLYSKVSWERTGIFSAAKLLFYVGTIDCFCLECGKPSTFRSERTAIPAELTEESYKRELKKIAAVSPMSGGSIPTKPEPPLIKPDIYLSAFSCGRNYLHKIQFLYKVQNEITVGESKKEETAQFLEKIGQYPSIAELSLPEIKKYRTVVANDVYSDLAKGIGLAAHDVGIGSYVYLRRVFERLIEDAHILAKNNSEWDEDSYQKNSRMAERITALKDYLPEFLVSHSSLYGLLSKGLHELSEEECLKHFQVIRVGIEFILDQEIEAKARRTKIEEASKAINRAVGLVKGNA